jgi:hypothetical protein
MTTFAVTQGVRPAHVALLPEIGDAVEEAHPARFGSRAGDAARDDYRLVGTRERRESGSEPPGRRDAVVVGATADRSWERSRSLRMRGSATESR